MNATAAIATQNLNVVGTRPIVTPRRLTAELPMTAAANDVVIRGRETIRKILRGEDPRLLVVVGPCSVHDVKAAKEYAERLAALSPARRGSALRRDARLLREAAHDGRLEGPDQRPAPRRLVRHGDGPAPRPAVAARRQRDGPAVRDGTARPDHRRSTSTIRSPGPRSARGRPNRQTHRQMASGLSHAGRLQELDRRQPADRDRRAQERRERPSFPRHRRGRPDVRRADPRQHRRPRHPPRRRRPDELRSGERPRVGPSCS